MGWDKDARCVEYNGFGWWFSRDPMSNFDLSTSQFAQWLRDVERAKVEPDGLRYNITFGLMWAGMWSKISVEGVLCLT